MGLLSDKARNYFITGIFSEKIGNYDVSCTNYFKSLSAIGDFILEKKGLLPQNHNERFDLLRKNDSFLYKLTSTLFLLYRKTYSNKINAEDSIELKTKLMEAFSYAKIDIPTDKEIEEHIKRSLKK